MINKLSAKNNNNFNQKTTHKNYSLKFKNFFKVAISVFLFFGGITSIVFSAMSAVSSGAPKDQFGDAYNLQYHVQLSTKNTSGEGNLNTVGKDNISNEDAASRLKASADAFKNFLVNENIDFEGVQYKIDENINEAGIFTGTIYTNLFNIEILDNIALNTNNQFPRSSSEVLFSNYKSNFIEIVPFNTSNESKYNNGFYDANLNKPFFNNYGLNFSEAFIQSGNQENENIYDDENHLVINTESPFNISNFADSLELRYSTEDTTEQSEIDKRKMIIFKDADFLIQKMNYSNLLNFWIRDENANNFINKTLQEFEENIPESSLPEAIANLPYPTEIINQKIYEDYLVIYEEGDSTSVNIFETSQNILNYLKTTSQSFWKQFPTLEKWTKETYSFIPHFSTAPQIVTKHDLFMMANNVRQDGSRYIPIPSSESNSSKTVSSNAIYNQYSFQLVSEMAIVDEITLQNYSEYFPQTNTIDQDPEILSSPGQVDNLRKIAFPIASLSNFDFGIEATSNLNIYLNQIKNITSLSQANVGDLSFFPYPEDAAISSIATIGGNSRYEIGNTQHIPTILQKKIANLSVYNSMFLVIGVILLLVGIIVSILYRIPGLFAFLAMAGATAFTAGLLAVLNFNFSFGLFLGITFVIILSLASILLILERCRKRFLESRPAFEAGIGSIKKTLISIIDLHVGSILIALALVFFGANELQDFGFSVIVGSVVSFISIISFFILNFYLFVSDVRNRSIKLYFFNKISKVKFIEKNNVIPSKNLYHSVLEKGLKFNFNWKISILIIAILAIIVIIVLSLIFTIGFSNSLDFNNGSVIYISGQNVGRDFNIYQSILGIDWTTVIFSNDLIVFGKSNVGNIDELIAKIGAINVNAVVNSAISSSVATINIFKQDITALVAGIGFAGLYALIRFNIFGGVPIFISTLFAGLIGISFCYAAYFFVESNSVLAFAFAASINFLMSMGYVSATNSRFSKKEIFERKKINEFINANANNLKYYWISIIIIVVAITITQFAFASPSFYWIIGTILLAAISGIITSIISIMTSYYVLILLRQLYLRNTIYNSITNRSSKYDLIDEELIKGINYYE